MHAGVMFMPGMEVQFPIDLDPTELRASFTSEADEPFELQMELPGSGGALPGGELVTVHDTVVVEPGEIVEY